MLDDLKTHEWFFLGLAAVAGFLLVRHFIEKFSDNQPGAGTGPESGPRSTSAEGYSQGAGQQQRDDFKRSSDHFSSKGTSGEQSEWFRRGKDGADAQGADRGAETATPRHWYQVLEVSSVATIDEIRQAYKRKIRLYHPDKVSGLGPEFTAIAEAKAKEINQAYEQACAARGANG